MNRLFVALDRPETCPHGFPIPEPEDDEVAGHPPLYVLEPGEVAEVAMPSKTDPELVEFLETLGVVPGVQVEVIEKHPFDGPLVVSVGGQARTIGERVARQIYVNRRTNGPAAQTRKRKHA